MNQKIVKELHFSLEGKQKLINGIDKLAEAVGSTLGAGGKTVVLEDDFGGPWVTKDGVTVANHIILEDPVENLGVSMIKQAARNTAQKAGDGTTTSIILAQAIIHEYVHQEGGKHSFRDIKKGIEDFRDTMIKFLEKKAVAVNDNRLEDVSIISANGDKELGKLISDAFIAAGEHGVVTQEISPDSSTYIETVEGTQIQGAITKMPHFYTQPEKELTELEKPLILLCTSEIDNIRRIQDILEYAIKSNRSILLVAPMTQQPLSALAMNRSKGNIKVNVVDPPSYGLKRKDILDDVALLTGAKVIDTQLGDSIDLISPDVLGSADKAISDNEGTTLVFDEVSEEVHERIAELKEKLEKEESQILIQHYESRLALLLGGVSVIRIGASTEVEMKEKRDRVDDAVHAVKAAKKEGILPGGGSALKFASELPYKASCTGRATGFQILSNAVNYPISRILTNAGLSPVDFDFDKWGQGVDVISGKVVDMRKAGIIDPLLVTKEALKNAVSVAITILSTHCVISNARA